MYTSGKENQRKRIGVLECWMNAIQESEFWNTEITELEFWKSGMMGFGAHYSIIPTLHYSN
jgi:hypothetical protein